MIDYAQLVIELVSKTGFHTQQNIIVFESDDWGSIRVPSFEALELLRRKYPNLLLDHYQVYDGLEKAEDLSVLEDLLRSFETEACYPKFTLNYTTANPVFDRRLLEEEYFTFSFEPISITFNRYDGKESALDYYLHQAVSDTCFRAQLHGREHLNATRWIEGIKKSDYQKDAFLHDMIGFNADKYNNMDPLNKSNTLVDRAQYLSDAVTLFKEQFGYCSKSFIPPCYVINDDDYGILGSLGVETIQGSWLRNKPKQDGSLSRRLLLLGRINRFSQVQLIRNCNFEPSKFFYQSRSEEECVTKTMGEIKTALRRKQPAVVCTHRVNYTSRISETNRDFSLRCLKRLLFHITREVENPVFMFSDELGEYIKSNKMSRF